MAIAAENKFRTYVSVKAARHKNDVFIYDYKFMRYLFGEMFFFADERAFPRNFRSQMLP